MTEKVENVSNQVDGVVMPPDGPGSWPKSDSRQQWLVFYRLDQLTLNGTGIIEGNGEQWWELPCKPHRVIILSSSLKPQLTEILIDRKVFLFGRSVFSP